MNLPNLNFSRRLSITTATLLVTSFVLGCSSREEPETVATVAPPPQKRKEAPPTWVPGPSADEIKTAVRGRNADLRQCYLAGTFKNSQLAGTVNVSFTIDTKGRVSRTSDAGSDIADPEVVTCVLEVFGKLDFLKGGSSDTEVEYPVIFGHHG